MFSFYGKILYYLPIKKDRECFYIFCLFCFITFINLKKFPVYLTFGTLRSVLVLAYSSVIKIIFLPILFA